MRRAAAQSLVLPLFALLALTACATRPMPKPGEDASVSRAVQQPMRDLSLIREAAPPVLARAWGQPYASTPADSCASITAELDELDAALGPDLAGSDKPGSAFSVTGLASDAVGSAVGLPFRGIVRTVTGAEQRDRSLHAAVTAGMVRRGFLKGRLLQMQCPKPGLPLTGPGLKGDP